MAELLPGDEIAPSLEAIMSRPIVGVDTYAAKKALMGRRRSAPASLPLLHGVRVAQVDQGEGEGMAEQFGFIRYNKSPQTGNPPYPSSWLEIYTTAQDGDAPSGYSWDLDGQEIRVRFDRWTTNGDGYLFETEAGGYQINTATGGYEVDTGGGGQDFLTRGGGFNVNSDSGTISLLAFDGAVPVRVGLNGGVGMTVDLAATRVFEVSDDFGNPILTLTG